MMRTPTSTEETRDETILLLGEMETPLSRDPKTVVLAVSLKEDYTS